LIQQRDDGGDSKDFGLCYTGSVKSINLKKAGHTSQPNLQMRGAKGLTVKRSEFTVK